MRPVREIAHGRWRGILVALGLPEHALHKRHGPCPMCGGRDRFRFDDREGRGTWFCSHCGAGDGVALLMAYKGMDFKSAALEIESVACVQPMDTSRPERSDRDKLERLRRVWSEAIPVTADDEAMTYLAGRGLDLVVPPTNLRLHPALAYHDGERVIGKFPCMVARVQDKSGAVVSIHRTYLKDGRKAPVKEPKKLMPGKPVSGAAIRLSPIGVCLGITEGIETALAASTLFQMPVWSCVTAHGVETFDPPNGVTNIVIFADNDESFTGQKAAYAAAHRLGQRGIHVDVQIPRNVGDWLDVYRIG